MQCVGIVYEHRVCTFYDVLVWAGRVFYISRDPGEFLFLQIDSIITLYNAYSAIIFITKMALQLQRRHPFLMFK